MNTKNTAPKSVGRPAFTITYPRGAFTIKELHAANPQAKWALTIRQHVEKSLESGFLSKLDRKEVTGKVGKPADLFIRTAVLKAIEARKAAKAGTPTEAPAVVEVSLEDQTPSETPSETVAEVETATVSV